MADLSMSPPSPARAATTNNDQVAENLDTTRTCSRGHAPGAQPVPAARDARFRNANRQIKSWAMVAAAMAVISA